VGWDVVGEEGEGVGRGTKEDENDEASVVASLANDSD